MQRITITIDEELMAAIDAFIGRRGYENRSEAIRDLARSGMEQQRAPDDTSGDCAAAVVYVYDHETRDLAKTAHAVPASPS